MRLASAYWRRVIASGLGKGAHVLVASAVAAMVAGPMLPALAQSGGALGGLVSGGTPPAGGDRLLLEADELIYDFDRETVTAKGGVQVYYGEYVLDADMVVYDQKADRLIATGGVRMLEPGGNLVVAERLDITEDFRDGFVESLTVITTDRARYTAQTAERRDGNLMIFRRGVYTACEPCLEHPERPPFWQLKAARIIHNKTERTIYYENARLEILGIPVAYVPLFFHPDPTVRRKTGLLTPTFLQSTAIGFGVTTPFFWNLAPNYDVTFSPTMLTRQGLLAQAEWRHQLIHGSYNIRLAGIFQQEPEAFAGLSGDRDLRGSAHSVGTFWLSTGWSAGWSADVTSDRTFNRDYMIPDATGLDLTSTVYLNGISERNYFNAAGYYYQVQREDTVETLPDDGDPTTADFYRHDDQGEQPVVHPVIDHNYIVGDSIFGGELRLDSNLTSLTRDASDIRHPPAPYPAFYSGIAGTFTRATHRASWQRRFIAPGGQLVTPFTYVQADLNWIASDDPAAGLTSGGATGRVMPAAGIEYEWPFLASIGSSVHTFGPKLQVIARPDEWNPGSLPNEDAQSIVFDDTSLFEWDKFSGYDRQEGGTRANVGFVYQGLFSNGASVDALVGRSFQLAGENSFALRDHALTGVGSGLESDNSDYIARLTLNTGLGVAVTARGRFDDDDFELNRGELAAVGTYGRSVVGVDYAFIRESPSLGVFNVREEASASAAIALLDNWSMFGSIVYDLANTSEVSRSLGLRYSDECTTLSATYLETTDPYTDLVSSRAIYFRLALRTVTEQSYSRQLPIRPE